MQKKVAIIGCDLLTRSQAPWDDSTWSIWGMNGSHVCADLYHNHTGVFHADAWFQIHPPQTWSASETDWFDQLNAGEVRVATYIQEQDFQFVQATWPEAAKACLPFPLQRILTAYPQGLFFSTFCWEIAFALVEGFTDIALFGADSRGLGREIVVERPALLYWLGVAHTQGVRMTFPGSTLPTLSRYHQYGFDYLEEAAYAATLTECVVPQRWLREAQTPDDNLDTVASVDKAAPLLKK